MSNDLTLQVPRFPALRRSRRGHVSLASFSCGVVLSLTPWLASSGLASARPDMPAFAGSIRSAAPHDSTTVPNAHLSRRVRAHAAEALSFAAPVDYASASGPTSVVLADLNEDGAPDILASYSDGISVMLANGARGFTSHVEFVTGNAPASIITDDFNGDGHLDAAVALTASHLVAVMLGHGTGELDSLRVFDVGIYGNMFGYPACIASGDLNGDAIADLVATNSTDKVSVLLGDGHAMFAPPLHFNVGGYPRGVAIADIDGDSVADIVSTGTFGTISVLLNQGDGTSFRDTTLTVTGTPYDVAVADVNLDGRPDILACDATDNVVDAFLASEPGKFAAPVVTATGLSPRELRVADLGGSSAPDIVTADATAGGITILEGLGDSHFMRVADVATGSMAQSLALGYVDADGKPDIAVANTAANTVSVLLNQTSTDVRDTTRAGDADPASLPLRVRNWSEICTNAVDLTLVVGVTMRVRVELYDVQGRLAARLFEGRVSSGEQRLHLSLHADRALAGGVYDCCVSSGAMTVIRRVVLVR